MGSLSGMAGGVPGLGEVTVVKDIVGGFLGPIADLLKAGTGQVVPIAAIAGSKDAKAMVAAQNAQAAEALRIQAIQAETAQSVGVLQAALPWLAIGGGGIALAFALAWAAGKKGAKRQ
jgi:hypothetical protein